MEYFILYHQKADRYCGILKRPADMQFKAPPARGKRAGDRYQDGQKFQMAPEIPGTEVPDVIRNAVRYLMVSARMKSLLEEHATAEIEFLRFTLLDHQGQVAKDDCYLANVLGTVDCVDMERTEGTVGETRKGVRIERLRKLYLRDEAVDPGRNIFRIAPMPAVIVVREDLKAALEAAQITGAEFFPMGADVRI
jgi:hypothetical protein